jgi:single-stranded-DNA-specific exonuclease
MDYKKQIYKDLNITDETVPEWKNTMYRTDPAAGKQILGLAKQAKHAVIFGDYDCDGICASYITETALKTLCPGLTVTTLLPERSEGYGVNRRMIDTALEKQKEGQAIVLTVDTGITAAEAVKELKAAGVSVVVTDHHEFKDPEALPPADLVIDPNAAGIDNPLTGKNWCGAAVAFKLFEPYLPPHVRHQLMCYAGVASVADCITMRDGTWQLVRRTLDAFHTGTAPKALIQLLEKMERDVETMNEDTLGFYLGPAFNAAGRLYSPLMVLDYLREPDDRKAEHLVAVNEERKTVRDQEYAAIREAILRDHKENDNPIWVYAPGLHTGIIGILASQVEEEFRTSAIVLTDNASGTLTGSARAYGGLNMYEYLTGLKDHLTKFGGYPGAAGLSCTMEDYHFLEKQVTEKPHIPVQAGLPLTVEDITPVTELVDGLRPYGEGFPEPEFHMEVNLKKDPFRGHDSMMGGDKNHLGINLKDNAGNRVKMLHFFHTEDLKEMYPDDAEAYSCHFIPADPRNPYGKDRYAAPDKHPFLAIGKLHASWFRGSSTPEYAIETILDPSEPVETEAVEEDDYEME